MRIAMLASLCALTLSASAGAATRSLTSPGPVTALAADGRLVAFASGRSRSDCDRVRIWDARRGWLVRLGRTTSCEATSTGTGIAALALAGSRVLWLHYTGGNIREWSLFTATPASPTPRRLRFVTQDVDATAPIVVGDGDASRLSDILAYALGREVVALRANGARRFAWRAPSRVVALSALGGELAVAHGSHVTVLDASGAVLRQEAYGNEIQEVRITGNGLLAQRGRTLELRNLGTKTWELPAGARLADATGDRAVYLHRGRARAIFLASRKSTDLGPAALAAAEGPNLWLVSGRIVRYREPF